MPILNQTSEWERVKRKRDLFEVKDYRDNHSYSIYKSDIDMLYYELRDEELMKMKKNPAGYGKYYVEKLMAANIFKLWDFFDHELMTEESWDILQRGRDEFPDIDWYQFKDPNLKAPENSTNERIEFVVSPEDLD